MERTKEAAKAWIEAGKPCAYRFGWGWKGAKARPLSRDEALDKLPSYSFGKGFYSLSWVVINGSDTLLFNELSDNDMW